MKKVYYILLMIATLSAFSLNPAFVLADQEKEVKAAVAVAAVVPSKVATNYSSSIISPTQVLADASQSAVISVVLKDGTETPLSDINVCVYSNRGDIDKFTAVDGSGNPIASAPWGISVAHAATQTINGTTCTLATTNAQGQAYIKVASNVPGESLITIIVDNIVQLAQLKLTFLPLPFPKYVSIGFEVPKFIAKSGEITIFKPTTLPGSEAQNTELVNLGVRIVIPFWVVVILTFMTILTPILFAWVLILLKKIKKINTEEKADIERTEQLVEKEEQEIEKLVEKDGGSGSSPTSSI